MKTPACVLLLFAVACHAERPPLQVVQVSEPPAPQAQPAFVSLPLAPAHPTAVVEPGQSNFGTITLAPGFIPDPYRAQGTSGSATDASSLSPSCAGYISATPDHLFVADGAFTNLRIMAKSDVDVTLVIRRPDGNFVCADDTDNTNPIISAPFPAGTYSIWVGSYDASANGAYTLGVTELNTVMPSTL